MREKATPVTIIIPVYGDWPSLEKCVKAALRYTNLSVNKLLLVNDRGPEHDEIEENLKGLIDGKENVEYHANNTNLGFLQSCNNAVMNIDKTANDILLLNSDAEVTEDYLEALQSVFLDNGKIAAVSPRSNNATIATIPIKYATTKKNTKEQSYEFFNKYSERLPAYNISPVAHGFCMLVRRTCIKEHGLFDTIYGKGYGEEVDFCLRVRKHGWLVAISNRAFVYHLEARSFTAETKKQLIKQNEEIVVKRYPSFRKQARDYRLKILDQENAVEFGSLAAGLMKSARIAKQKIHHLMNR